MDAASSISDEAAALRHAAGRSTVHWRIEESAAAYAEVDAAWRDDEAANPFVAPAFVRVMHRALSGERPLFAIASDDTGAPVAVWPLRLGTGRTLRFLALDYSDQSTCITRADIDAAALGEGLAFAIRSTGATRLALTNVPAWGPTLDAVRAATTQMGWHARQFPAWPCPTLRARTGGAPGSGLRASIEEHKRLRGYANALRREPGYVFEVIEDASAMDAWCSEFCATHRERWKGTDTPSPYAQSDAGTLLREVLGAWGEDGVLVRFAISIAGRRVALAACLRSGTRMIYYLVATSPAAERSRAGHVLIRLIGLWASERGFDTLDFGAGGEEYKYRYANADERLWRVFAAASPLSPAFLRGVIEARIRRSPVLQRRWDAATNGRIGNAVRRRIASMRAALSSGARSRRSATD